MKDELAELYSKASKSLLNENTESNIVVDQTGELEGETGKVQPNTGPESSNADLSADNPDEFSTTKKTKKSKSITKENVNMKNKSFMDLFNEVVNENGIESDEYDDESGDFPAGEGEIQPDDEFDDEMGEATPLSIIQDIAAKFDELIVAMGGESDLDDLDSDLEGDLDDEIGGEFGEDEPVSEMKSEPTPKNHNSNISSLQAPRKLGGSGVKTSKRSAKKTSAKKRTGELEAAPVGFKPGDKGAMKVGGTGPAASGKNASAFE